MNYIKRKLYLLYFIIVAIFMLVFYFVLSNIVENRIEEQETKRLDHDMISLTTYIDEQIQQNGIDESDTEEAIQILETIVPIVNERVTFLDPEGNVLYDSSQESEKIGEIFNAFEIQKLLEGEMVRITDYTTKRSAQPLYFVAQAVYNETNQPLGILRIASEIPDLADIIRLVFIVLLIGMVLLATFLFLLLKKWMDQITTPIDQMQGVLSELSVADYEVRYVGQSYKEINDLGNSINELAENLEQQELELKTSEKRMERLINHLIVGVMLLDENRIVRIVNPAMNELLNVNLYGEKNLLYTDYIKSAELTELIERSYALKKTLNAEITIYFPDEKILDANVVPIPGKEEGEKNYIVLLYNITEMRRLENIRTDFTANVSHELRTPVTALKGFSETLLDGAMYDEKVLKEFLEIMSKEATRLDSMVQDILQLSKLEQRKLSVSTEKVNLREVAEEVLTILQQRIDQKKMTCWIEEDSPVTITANRDQLKQILMNLVANAIIYTPAEGMVIIHLSQVDNEAHIQVIDNGIGLSKKDQTRIFERFYRVDKARSRNSGGTGLGLSIVKWLVENMNGRLELFSEENIGTTFGVILPINPVENNKKE